MIMSLLATASSIGVEELACLVPEMESFAIASAAKTQPLAW